MKIKRDTSERVLLIFSTVFMSIFTILCVYPFYYVIIGSITSASHSGYVFLYPMEITFATYKQLLSKPTIYMAFFISVSRTALGTALQVFFTGMLAYLMTKQDMRYRSVFLIRLPKEATLVLAPAKHCCKKVFVD